MAVPTRTTKCEICGVATNTSFGSVGNLHYYCKEHKDEVFTRVTGRKPKKTPKPKN